MKTTGSDIYYDGVYLAFD